MGDQWTEARFYTIDYVIMGLFLAISMVIGVYFGIIKKQRTTEEYLLGGRKMQLVPVALSMLVTFQSAIAVIGTPMEVFAYNTMIFHIHIGIALAFLIQYLLLVPLFHPLKLISVYEYLRKRFNSRTVQLLGTYIGMLQTLLYMAVVLYAPALALEAVAKIPLWMSVVVIGFIGTIYTSLGGLKSVIWTDVFQFIMMYGGLMAILIVGGQKTGSFGKIIDITKDGGRFNFSSHSFDPRVRHTLWSCILGPMFNWLSTCCSQASIQRICSMKTEKEAKWAVLLNIPLVIIFGAVLVLTGMVLYAYFVVYQCDPLAAGFITNVNQIVPYFVMHVLSDIPGLAGIFVAALFSGALSSLSSGINSMAANTIQDILGHYLEDTTQIRKTLIAKVLVCLYGGLVIALAYGLKELPGPIMQIAGTAFGSCGGPVAGIFFLGAIFPQSNWIGAFSGGIVGIIFNIWLAISCLLFGNKTPISPPITTEGCFGNTTIGGYNYTTVPGVGGVAYTTLQSAVTTPLVLTDTSAATGHLSLYDISYLYFGLTGITVSMVTGVLISLLTGGDRGEPADPIYILPCLRKYWKLGYRTVQPPQELELYEQVQQK